MELGRDAHSWLFGASLSSSLTPLPLLMGLLWHSLEGCREASWAASQAGAQRGLHPPPHPPSPRCIIMPFPHQSYSSGVSRVLRNLLDIL